MAAIVCSAAAARGAEPFRFAEGKHGQGELRYVSGVPVLLVQGSPAEIGEQIGVLALKPLVQANKELLDRVLRNDALSPVIAAALKTGALMLPQFPADHVAELEAMAKAGGVPLDVLVFANTLPEMVLPNVGRLQQCSTLVVEAERSATGAPLFGRNMDWPVDDFPLHEYSLVTVYRPRGKRAYAIIGFPGMVGFSQGINEAGLALAGLSVTATADNSLPLNVAGTPAGCAARRALEECTTVAEAEALIRPLKPTAMSNVALCDKHRGAVFEITTKQLVVRESREAVCACTNHFRMPELAVDTSCPRYAVLEKCRQMARLDLADVAEKLDEVGNEITQQTMIFEPARLKLHLAYGPAPASQYPLAELDLAELFAKGEFPADSAAARRQAPSDGPRVKKTDGGMYEVVFRYRPVGPVHQNKAVYLAGTFNKWKPAELKMEGPDADGWYETSLPLSQGRYEYKFVIDGRRWRPDPNNGERSGPYKNSVLEVGR